MATTLHKTYYYYMKVSFYYFCLDKQTPPSDLQGRRTRSCINKLCCSWCNIPQPFKSVGSDWLVGMVFQEQQRKLIQERVLLL